MLRRKTASQQQQAGSHKSDSNGRHNPSNPDRKVMPRRFFRKFALKRHQVSEQWFMSPFRHLLHDRRLWGIRRRTVVPAFAIGLFIAFLPTPGHTIMSILSAIAFRVNIPVAAVSTLVSNPVTMGPMYYLAYQLGQYLLDTPFQEFQFEMSWNWVTHTFVTIWQPMLLGCIILGIAAAVIGYIVLDLFWRLSIADYKTRKRNARRNRES
jgi:uncharacterized protein (DUF2062 family)